MYLYIKFQLNCFFTVSWNISVKEIFSFQKLKVSFSETASRVISSVVLIAYKEVICKNENRVLQRIIKINIWWSNQYTEAVAQMFFEIGVLWNFSNFTGKQLCRSLFLVTWQAWRLATLWKKDSNTGAFL